MRDEKRMELFRDILMKNGLMDLVFFGPCFTWGRGNTPETNIKERLNKRVANEEWSLRFLNASVKHLSHVMFNHCPLLLNLVEADTRMRIQDFQFKAWWIMETFFESEVRKIWSQLTSDIFAKATSL